MPNESRGRPAARRLLLLSNSRDAEGRVLVYARAALEDALAGVTRAVFVPFAAVSFSLDVYVERVREIFRPFGVELESVHHASDPADAVRCAGAIIVGGGNTFQLLRRLASSGLLSAIRERVHAGVPYIGWSAGSVVACPTISTTNDMPIAEPPGLGALGLVPFQINAHYTDFHPPGHQGETRAERIAEFLVLHPRTTVVGLREGSALRVTDRVVELTGRPEGGAGARVFASGRAPVDYPPGADLSFLLGSPDAALEGVPAWR
ncbi:MAG TPA: dipeptidase PepE [Gemmatimonadaceae bacterium]|nr:dipeptidase PepE [Gemmatimonadaceae bacterium]